MIRWKSVVVPGVAVLTLLCGGREAWGQTRVPEKLLFLSLDGGTQTGSQQLQVAGSPRQVYGEDLVIETDYNIDRGAASFRGNLTVRLLRNLGAAIGFTRTSSVGSAEASVEVPHPVFVARPRTVGRSLTTLGHRENMYLFQAAWIIQLDDRADLQILGGPALMRVDQAVVTDVTFRESGPPFTSVQLSRVERVEQQESGVGFSVGLDFSYLVSENYGAGAFVQYVGGSLDFVMAGVPTSVTVGGLQLGGGFRLRF